MERHLTHNTTIASKLPGFISKSCGGRVRADCVERYSNHPSLALERSTCQTLAQPNLMLSSTSFSDEPIPDPIKLLQRLAALELRIDQLRRDCLDVAGGRKEIAFAVTGVQVDNVRILRQVSDMFKFPKTRASSPHRLHHYSLRQSSQRLCSFLLRQVRWRY